jgi:excisionase family DNA binding protein
MHGDVAAEQRPGSVVEVGRTRRGSEQLLSAAEVAEMIGMTTEYVYELSRRGRIPTITFGRKRRYRREAVVRWLEELEGRTVR